MEDNTQPGHFVRYDNSLFHTFLHSRILYTTEAADVALFARNPLNHFCTVWGVNVGASEELKRIGCESEIKRFLIFKIRLKGNFINYVYHVFKKNVFHVYMHL